MKSPRKDPHVLGIDYGTDSVRALVVRVRDGAEVAVGVKAYPRWARGEFCNPVKNQARQHPLDYLEGLQGAVSEALGKSGALASRITAMGIDTTGSTPIAVDQRGTALALTPGFAKNPNAMFLLWKDHSAVAEAQAINDLAPHWGGPDVTKYSGGIYSSEWFWAKILWVLRHDPGVAKAAFSWVEHCDWLPALLTGHTDPLTLRRSRCAAGHKAMWHPDWGGLPPEAFLRKLDRRLSGLRDRLYLETHTSDTPAGHLSPQWAARLGLPAGITVAVGAFDAHLGAVGAHIKPFTMTKVMGTSTCDMVLAPGKALGKRAVKGICGQVDGSITPGFVGLEAGQSAFGDLYAWYRKLLLWPLQEVIPTLKGLGAAQKKELLGQITEAALGNLSKAAAAVPPGESALTAVDWMNGRRTPDADQTLTGAISGISLGADAPRLFRALVEATAFGALAIIHRFEKEGVPIQEVIALGGIARKNPFVMQLCADVFGRPIRVVGSDQCCALGSAMAAAVAAGLFPDIPGAQKIMASKIERTYQPHRKRHQVYQELYGNYQTLGAHIEAVSHKSKKLA